MNKQTFTREGPAGFRQRRQIPPGGAALRSRLHPAARPSHCGCLLEKLRVDSLLAEWQHCAGLSQDQVGGEWQPDEWIQTSVWFLEEIGGATRRERQTYVRFTRRMWDCGGKPRPIVQEPRTRRNFKVFENEGFRD
jgi:hypothetical protein